MITDEQVRLFEDLMAVVEGKYENTRPILMEVTRKRDNVQVVLLCIDAVHEDQEDHIIVPIAELIDGDLSDLYEPPEGAE